MTERDELNRIVDEVRDDPARRDMSRIIEREYSQARFEGFGEWDQARLVAHRLHSSGYRKPPVIENDKLLIQDGMLLLDVGDCTCTPYGSSHERHCGVEYLDDLTKPLERAGYAKPRVITTAEALDALPEGSVALGWSVGGRTVYLRVRSGRGRLVWGCVGSSQCYQSADLLKEGVTATVIHEPAVS
ncbi:hypothetical protein QE394_001123 [Arthrobacter sp. SORGH_AS 212]|uniref:hypothetical protein n=1 Tax=Pseudarthrobacter sp. SORGH_AS 212 TaxID=3041777 RepID=UPI00277E5211|nr:hypothetical protein [Arthrobacter sp. SORGH_AS_0212]